MLNDWWLWHMDIAVGKNCWVLLPNNESNAQPKGSSLIGVGRDDWPPPPSEPDGRFSRIRLSGQWFTFERIDVMRRELLTD